MTATDLDLSAFATRSPAGRRIRLPESVQTWHRASLRVLIGLLLGGICGAALLAFGLMSWNRGSILLLVGGAIAAPACVLMLKQAGSTAASRIDRFAADNGLTFEPLKDSAGHRGTNFTQGSGHRRLMVVTARLDGTKIEVGNLSSRFHPTHAPFVLPGYVAITLPERLPHTLITSRGTLSRRVWCHPSDADEVHIGAGGAFRVFAPPRAHHVVRSFFTGQTIDVFNRLTRRWCIEIMDDMMFLHSRWPVSTGSARTWRKVLGDIAEVSALLDASPVWSTMRHQPRRFLQKLPKLTQDVDEARVARTVWGCFAALMVVVTAVVSWQHDW